MKKQPRKVAKKDGVKMAGKKLDPKEQEKRKSEKADKFKKLAAQRTGKMLKGFKGLMNMRSSAYVSDQPTRDKITKALRNGLEQLETVYGGEKDIAVEESFTL